MVMNMQGVYKTAVPYIMIHSAVHCRSALCLFNIRLSFACLMIINVFDRNLTFSFLNTSDGFLRLRPQVHTSSSFLLFYNIKRSILYFV